MRYLLSLTILLTCCHTSRGAGEVETARAPARSFAHEVKGSLEQMGGIPVLSLRGTPEEMGYAEGALLCGRMTRFFQDYYLVFMAPLLQRSIKSYADFRQQAMVKFTLSGADEQRLRAMILGLRERCQPEDLLIQEAKDQPRRQLQYEDLVAGHAMIDLLLAACSSFTVWGEASATGGTLHGRNLDFLSDPGGTFLREQMIKVHLPTDGTARWAALSWPGNLGCPTCFAEDGSGLSSHGGDGGPSETATGNTLSMLSARDALLASLAARANGDPMSAAESALERRATLTKGVTLHFFWPGPRGAAVLEYDGVLSHADGRVTIRNPNPPGPEPSDCLLCIPSYEKRHPASLQGTNRVMREILALGIKKSRSEGGLDVQAAWRLLAASAAANELPTLHTVVMDLRHKQLHLSFSREPGQDSNLVPPVAIALDKLFTK